MTCLILLIGPMPPPMAGVERAMKQLMDVLGEVNAGGVAFARVSVIDTQVHATNANKGKFRLESIGKLMRQVKDLLLVAISQKPNKAIVSLSQNFTGLFRDSIFLILCRIFKIEVIGWVHGGNLTGYLESHPSRWPFQLILSKMVKTFVVPSSRLIEPLASMFPNSTASCIPHSLGPRFFENQDPNLEYRSDFAFIGKVAASKGWNDFARIIKEMQRDGGSATIRVIGEIIDLERNVPGLTGEATLHLDLLTDENYLPSADDCELRNTYQGSKIVVIPSYSESFCFVAAEAMASNSVVVGYRSAGLEYLFGNELQSYLIEVGDQSGLKKLMSDTIQLSPQTLRSLGFKFGARIRDVLDQEKIARQWQRTLGFDGHSAHKFRDLKLDHD